LLVDPRDREIEVFAISFWGALCLLDLCFYGHNSVLLFKFM
jgi:hypothetical protein